MFCCLSDPEFHALWRKAAEIGIARSDLEPYCGQTGLPVADLLNELSVVLAKHFIDGALSFEFCDSVMNGFLDLIVELALEGPTPQPAFSIYQAFDEGESLRRDDVTEIVPWEKYTRPALLEILRRC
ncbi:hypothetical protein [Pseudomonas nitroreducens]|uniref:hypothetical protein n=1 Tax=Pseudomonas nitroreducens TaxID=46680 RepID=UPI0028AC0FBF|nr:hypothetical protein [Pseudomonas nitroreducens]